MRIVVSGATGFVGRAPLLHLTGRGDHVTAWVRDLVSLARLDLGGPIGDWP